MIARRVLCAIGRYIESCFPESDEVRAGVDAAAEQLENELIASFDELIPVRIGTVAVAVMATATSPGAVSAEPPAAPAPGCPYGIPPVKRVHLDRFVQADNKFQK